MFWPSVCHVFLLVSFLFSAVLGILVSGCCQWQGSAQKVPHPVISSLTLEYPNRWYRFDPWHIKNKDQACMAVLRNGGTEPKEHPWAAPLLYSEARKKLRVTASHISTQSTEGFFWQSPEFVVPFYQGLHQLAFLLHPSVSMINSLSP